ncbi:MAG: DUF2829 domain-containing protein [Ammonifex sp.]|jgi:hypothetical protein|nr:MAG: DUF2829 domain-containing protein [Ammonifex sp.]
MPETYSFSEILEHLKQGGKASRSGWNGKGQYIKVQYPDEHSAPCNTLPYIFIITVQGERVPWLASQTDLMATDWVKEV